jgi:N-acetylglucosaminyldiphosphoundecaprenol N-acetyl-beta-D-mannosaminyltransferase
MTTLTAMPSSMDEKANPVCNVLGVGISAINLDRAVSTISQWIDRREHHYVCVTGVHGVMESQRSPELKRIHNEAGMVTPDGMPMVWLSRMGGFADASRVYGPDLMAAVCAESVVKGWRHFFFGGAEGVADQLKEKLTERFPGLQVAGTFCPPFRPMTPEEDAELIQLIDAAQPDIVWVGLSTPKQERWMAKHIKRLKAPVLVGVGAAFDFHAGLKRQAPKWMQRNGLEWFFRLVTEPKRLWKRYLINNPLFVTYLIAEKLGLRNFQ